MDSIAIIFLAVLQGLTEFLPISSSAHLILVPIIFGWEDQGLVFDIALHFGTLIAVVIYFKKDIYALSGDFLSSIISRETKGQSKMAWGLLVASIPVGLAGLLFKDFIQTEFRSVVLIAYATIIFGVLLGVADYLSRQHSSPRLSLSWFDMLAIGLVQTLALIPGTSRSGITLTMALLLGLSRQLGAKFIFLLSIPVIIASASLAMADLLLAVVVINWWDLLLAFVACALSAYAVIALFMKFIEKMSLMPFAIYRLLLGIILLGVYA